MRKDDDPQEASPKVINSIKDRNIIESHRVEY
jgi:hypothetical protein